MDFILFMLDKNDEDELYKMWLHKDTDKSFVELKRDNLKSRRKAKKSEIDVNGAIERIKQASLIIIPTEGTLDE